MASYPEVHGLPGLGYIFFGILRSAVRRKFGIAASSAAVNSRPTKQVPVAPRPFLPLGMPKQRFCWASLLGHRASRSEHRRDATISLMKYPKQIAKFTLLYICALSVTGIVTVLVLGSLALGALTIQATNLFAFTTAAILTAVGIRSTTPQMSRYKVKCASIFALWSFALPGAGLVAIVIILYLLGLSSFAQAVLLIWAQAPASD